ncbi:hypothetical protein NL676_029187 [Syzygium grande]|nr:hypothetical protein NL676_029187 [Syzygium grande]
MTSLVGVNETELRLIIELSTRATSHCHCVLVETELELVKDMRHQLGSTVHGGQGQLVSGGHWEHARLKWMPGSDLQWARPDYTLDPIPTWAGSATQNQCRPTPRFCEHTVMSTVWAVIRNETAWPYANKFEPGEVHESIGKSRGGSALGQLQKQTPGCETIIDDRDDEFDKSSNTDS